EDKQDDVDIEKDYQSIGDIDSVELSEDKKLIAVVYPDVNENNQDDRKEKINLSVDFGLDTEKQEKEIHVGQPLSLSNLYDKDHVFMGWYLDEGFNEKFQNGQPLTEDTSIYAKWKTPEKVVADSGENLIQKERVSNRIENYLGKKNKEITKEKKRKSKEREQELKEKEEDGMGEGGEKQYVLKDF